MHRVYKPTIAALTCLLLLGAASVQAAGDAEHGKVLANTCLGCHGIPGYRNAYPSYRVPKLGGQNEDYLVIALQGYQAGTRRHPTMNAQSDTLSDQNMRDLAAFFSSQGDAQPTRTEIEAGGDAAAGAKKIAVCTACHGPAGISPAPNWPNLAGQHKDYLVHSIKAYRDGGRKDPVMMGQVINLTDQDIADIAAFFAAQPGLVTAHYSN